MEKPGKIDLKIGKYFYSISFHYKDTEIHVPTFVHVHCTKFGKIIYFLRKNANTTFSLQKPHVHHHITKIVTPPWNIKLK